MRLVVPHIVLEYIQICMVYTLLDSVGGLADKVHPGAVTEGPHMNIHEMREITSEWSQC
jgi:hypothetical protein